MNEILELPEVRELVSRITPTEYHNFPERNERGRRTELIRGIVIEKMSKTPLHTFLADRIEEILRGKLPSDLPLAIRKDEPLTFGDSEPEPDFAIVPRPLSRDHHPATALLVIEISVTSLRLDRQLASLYAENGVGEYWIVDAGRQQVEVYDSPSHGRYLNKFIAGPGDAIPLKAIPGLVIPVAELFN
jgi:Uma2 family endonuclease